MTQERAGSVRAVKPRGLRPSRAKVLLPVAAIAAIAGVALVAVAQGGGDESAVSSVPSVADISAAEAQAYDSNLLAADGSAVADQAVTDTRGGEEYGVTVTTPTPTPTPTPEPSAEEESSGGGGGGGAETAPAADPGSAQAIAQQLVAERGWGGGEYDCLYQLYDKESKWDVGAENSSSGAYGIPQALPGSKMASAGDDWRTNPATQITWGLGYIADVYGTPCSAWAHSEAKNWY